MRRRWNELSEVERVGLYTRQSLYTLVWGFNAGVLVLSFGELDGGTGSDLYAWGGVVVTALGFAAMLAILRTGRLPISRLAPLLVAAAAYYAVAVTTWDGAPRGAAVTATVAAVLLSVGLLPSPRLAVALVLGSGVLVGASGGAFGNVVAGLILGGALIFTTRASMWMLRIVEELDAARAAQAQLAVVEERLRFSRDVHDVLGRRLSTIAVQSELASTLASRGDAEAAAARMLDVRGVAHEALREARELARGYRSVDLSAELEGARSLLRSAGIDVALDVAEVPRAWHEAAGWVVRESVTNVLRHSRATAVEIAADGGRLVIANDGVTTAAPSGDGSGLRGLRERLVPLGASLSAGSDGPGRWSVVATFPAAGPLSAAEAGR